MQIQLSESGIVYRAYMFLLRLFMTFKTIDWSIVEFTPGMEIIIFYNGTPPHKKKNDLSFWDKQLLQIETDAYSKIYSSKNWYRALAPSIHLLNPKS